MRKSDALMKTEDAYTLTRLAESNEFRCFMGFVNEYESRLTDSLVMKPNEIVAGRIQAVRRMNQLFTDARRMVIADREQDRTAGPGTAGHPGGDT